MPKIPTPLTDTKVKTAKPKDKLYKLSDGGGLRLWVLPTGAKTWRIDYINPNTKKSESLTLGSYPAFSLADARQWRDNIVKQLAHGGNPKVKKAQEAEAAEQEQTKIKTVYRFEVRLLEWHKRWAESGGKTGGGKNAKYANQVLSALEINIVPVFKGRDVREITTAEIVQALREMEERGVLEYLRRVKISLGLFFDYLVADGTIPINPVRIIGRQVFKTAAEKHFAALTPDELPMLVEKIENGGISKRSQLLIYWQLLTMTRPNEAAHARIDEIDLDKGLWEIPIERMKTRAHVVPLCQELIDLYGEIMALNVNGVYLFEGSGFNRPVTVELVRINLRNKLKLKTTAHGLRALARTYLRERYQIPRDVGELLLSHAVGDKTERAYSRLELMDERRHYLTLLAKDVMALRRKYQPK